MAAVVAVAELPEQVAAVVAVAAFPEQAAAVVAVSALPVTFPVRVPVTFPVKLPMNPARPVTAAANDHPVLVEVVRL